MSLPMDRSTKRCRYPIGLQPYQECGLPLSGRGRSKFCERHGPLAWKTRPLDDFTRTSTERVKKWEPRVRSARLRATRPPSGQVPVVMVDAPAQARFSLGCRDTERSAPQWMRRWRRRHGSVGVSDPAPARGPCGLSGPE